MPFYSRARISPAEKDFFCPTAEAARADRFSRGGRSSGYQGGRWAGAALHSPSCRPASFLAGQDRRGTNAQRRGYLGRNRTKGFEGKKNILGWKRNKIQI